MFYELRQYQIQPGKRDEWVRYMEEVIMPFQVSQGMVIAGLFVDEEHEDRFVWIRRFESEEQRAELYAAVYDSDRWKNEIAPPIGGLVVTGAAVITRLIPTARSVLH